MIPLARFVVFIFHGLSLNGINVCLQMFKQERIYVCTILVISVLAAIAVPPVSAQHGCYKGYCWSWCKDRNSGNWCYTTKGIRDDNGWVGCTSPAECNINWECANECHPKSYT